MDSPALLVVIAVIVAVVVAAFFLPGWLRRSTRTTGERAGRAEARSRTGSVLEELGSTIVLHAPEREARDLVDGVVRQHPRMFTPLDDGGIGIRFVDHDDAVARLASTGDDTVLQVVRSRELMGAPKGTEFWGELRSRTSAAAARRGIAVTAGPRVTLVRHDGTPAVWVASKPEAERS